MEEYPAPQFEKLIITGASQSFGPSLLALLGSLNLNWPNHPPVLVYDLGMDDETLQILAENQVPVRKVPPFVPHWRKHFTWKIWCWNNAPARDFVWMDAGITILRPVDDIFDAIHHLGYFINPSFYLLTDSATEAACHGCGVTPEFRIGKMTFNGGCIGFRKEGLMLDILRQSLGIASIEKYIESTQPLGRHDQAIISLLLYKYIPNPIMLDTMIYAGWEFPHQVDGQKIWQHRRTIMPQDMEHFAKHISKPGNPHIPVVPYETFSLKIKRFLKKTPHEIISALFAKLIRKGRERQIYNGVRD